MIVLMLCSETQLDKMLDFLLKFALKEFDVLTGPLKISHDL